MTQNIKSVTIHHTLAGAVYPSSDNSPYMIPVLIRKDEESNEDIYRECIKVVQCKNYITEFLFGTQLNRSYSTIPPRDSVNYPDYTNGHPLAIIYRFSNTEVAQTVLSNFKLLTDFEDRVNIPRTQVMWCDTSFKSLLVIGDSKWSHSSLMASIHIQFIRLLTYQNTRNATTLLEFKTNLINSYKTREVVGRDPYYFLCIRENRVDLEDLIVNIDKVVTPNTRYSGWNDAAMKENDYNTLSGKSVLILIKRGVSQQKNERGLPSNRSKFISANWNGYIHDYLGVHNFSNLYSTFKNIPKRRRANNDYDGFFNMCGSVWAYNYLRMVEKRREVNDQLSLAA